MIDCVKCKLFFYAHLQLFLDALVLLGLGETILLVAVVVDAFSLQVGAVRAGVLLAVAVVIHVVVHGGRWRRWWCCHHHVQLLFGLYQIVLGLPGLVRTKESVTQKVRSVYT